MIVTKVKIPRNLKSKVHFINKLVKLNASLTVDLVKIT